MKRVKVLIVLFVCMAVMGVWLAMSLVSGALGLLEALLNAAAKLLNDTGIAVQWAAIDLCVLRQGVAQRCGGCEDRQPGAVRGGHLLFTGRRAAADAD